MNVVELREEIGIELELMESTLRELAELRKDVAGRAPDMAPFRKFRHVVYHSYGFQLDWNRMREGIEKVEDVYSRFTSKLLAYLQTL